MLAVYCVNPILFIAPVSIGGLSLMLLPGTPQDLEVTGTMSTPDPGVPAAQSAAVVGG
jgi:hypothetical protein